MIPQPEHNHIQVLKYFLLPPSQPPSAGAFLLLFFPPFSSPGCTNPKLPRSLRPPVAHKASWSDVGLGTLLRAQQRHLHLPTGEAVQRSINYSLQVGGNKRNIVAVMDRNEIVLW